MFGSWKLFSPKKNSLPFPASLLRQPESYPRCKVCHLIAPCLQAEVLLDFGTRYFKKPVPIVANGFVSGAIFRAERAWPKVAVATAVAIQLASCFQVAACIEAAEPNCTGKMEGHLYLPMGNLGHYVFTVKSGPTKRRRL